MRLIAGDPGEVYDVRKIGRASVVFQWTFRHEGDLAPWHTVHLDLRAALHKTGLRVSFPRPDPGFRPQIDRSLDLDAAAVDAVELQVSGPRRDFRTRGRLQLYWSSADQTFSEERSLSVDAVQEMGAYVATYTLPVASHPLWKGRIARLAFDPTAAPDDTIDVHGIRGLKYETTPEFTAAGLERAWKVDLGNDLRPARLASPAHPFEWRIQVPERSTLRFAYGVFAAARGPVHFAVSLGEETGPTVALFEDLVRPGHRAPPEWKEAAIDLSRFAGRRVSLVFETRAEGSHDPARDPGAWANPELWQETSEALPPNVILVSLDTLRADRLSLYGNERQTSPQIDRWARRRATVFESTVAPSPWTLPSHASLFTGLDALRHGVNHGYPVPRSLEIMADRFRRSGYVTLAVTGGGYVGSEYGFDRGFDSFYSHRYGPGGGPASDAAEMEAGVKRSIDWLRRRGHEPFFLFLHTYAVHAPYRPRPPYFARFNGGDSNPPSLFQPYPVEPHADDGFLVRRRLLKQTAGTDSGSIGPLDLAVLRALYDSSVAYADDQLGRLFRELQALGLERRTIVVVTSDHGEALGERGLAEHAYLYDFNLLVPLVIAVPDGRGAGRRVSRQVRTVDILPTLLELAGVPPIPDVDGASLVSLIEGKPEAHDREAWSYAASTNYGVSLRVANRVKYIYNNTAWSPACGQEELYRLDGDVREEHNLAARGAEADRLRQRVLQVLGSRGSGLFMQLSNATPTAYRGSIEGPFLHQVRTKSPGPRCGNVAWDPGGGRIGFTVLPGQSYSVLLEGVGAGDLTLRATMQGRRFQATLDPRQLAQPWRLAYRGSSWRRADSTGGALDTGVAMRWMENVRVEEAQPSDTNQALREQLKALGYVQ